MKKPILTYDEFLNEQEELNEELFSGIKRRRALNKVSAASYELYDAIVKKYDIDIESSAYRESKEWYELSRAARLKKTEAYNQRLRAAQELISELTDKCNNLLNQRSDDDKFRSKATAMINDAKSRARREVMDRAEKEISKKTLDDFRTEFDDWADEEFGFLGIYKKPKKTPSGGVVPDDKKEKQKEFAKNHPKKEWVKIPTSYLSKGTTLETIYWKELDITQEDEINDSYGVDFSVDPNGDLWGKPTDDMRLTPDWSKFFK